MSTRIKLARKILSRLFFGLFVAIMFMMAWFAFPVLRDFPVGDDSPTAIGLPFGMLLGFLISGRLGRTVWFRRAAVWIGSVAACVAGGRALMLFSASTKTTGWDGLGEWIGAVILGFVFLGFLSLLLSGVTALPAKHPDKADAPND